MAIIRPGTADDLPGIAAVQAASPEAAQWDPADYLDHDLLVAVKEGQVAGFLVTREVGPAEREILTLAVLPTMRRRGISRLLISHVLREHPDEVYLEVRSSNLTAQKFYNSMGFKEIAVRRDYYDEPLEDAIVMKFHSC